MGHEEIVVDSLLVYCYCTINAENVTGNIFREFFDLRKNRWYSQRSMDLGPKVHVYLYELRNKINDTQYVAFN